jgi:hypothetical protein
MIALFAPMRTESGRIRISNAVRASRAIPFYREEDIMMKKVMLAVSTLALAVTAAPAFAQGSQDQDNDNTTNGAAGNNSDTVVVNDLIDLFVQDNAADTFTSEDNDGNGSGNGNTAVVAIQALTATNTNQNLDEVVDLDGEDDTPSSVGYNSGNNSVRGNAFAAYAGILNAAWNTGINANTQAATNIAAQGSVSFGDTSAPAGGGDGGGD